MSVVFYNISNSFLTQEENLIMAEVFGYASSAFIGLMMIPQIIEMFESESAKDLSITYMIFSLCGSILRLIYGVLINQLAVIIVPILGTIQTVILIVGKCFFDNKEKYMTEEIGKEKLRRILDIDDDMKSGLIKMLRKDVDNLEEMLKLLNNDIELENIHGKDDFNNFVVLFHEYYFKYNKIKKNREQREKCLKFLGKNSQ